MDVERLVEQLKKDEGFSARPYWDNDQWTYGYGTKAPNKDAAITPSQAEAALRTRLALAIAEFHEIFPWVPIDDVRAEAIVNMLYNLGRTKFSRFTKLIDAVRSGDWGRAAYEAYHSRWFQQLAKPGLRSIERAERIVWELLTGEKG